MLSFFSQEDGFLQSSQLVVYFLQFIVLVTLGYDAASSLEPEFVVTAYKGADGDGLVQVAVESDEPDATSVSASVVRFYFADQLHGLHLRSSTQGTGWKCINERLDGIGSFIQGTANPAYQMDDVAVVLRLLQLLS